MTRIAECLVRIDLSGRDTVNCEDVRMASTKCTDLRKVQWEDKGAFEGMKSFKIISESTKLSLRSLKLDFWRSGNFNEIGDPELVHMKESDAADPGHPGNNELEQDYKQICEEQADRFYQEEGWR